MLWAQAHHTCNFLSAHPPIHHCLCSVTAPCSVELLRNLAQEASGGIPTSCRGLRNMRLRGHLVQTNISFEHHDRKDLFLVFVLNAFLVLGPSPERTGCREVKPEKKSHMWPHARDVGEGAGHLHPTFSHHGCGCIIPYFAHTIDGGAVTKDESAIMQPHTQAHLSDCISYSKCSPRCACHFPLYQKQSAVVLREEAFMTAGPPHETLCIIL